MYSGWTCIGWGPIRAASDRKTLLFVILYILEGYPIYFFSALPHSCDCIIGGACVTCVVV